MFVSLNSIADVVTTKKKRIMKEKNTISRIKEYLSF
jgi:hypothetical protein